MTDDNFTQLSKQISDLNDHFLKLYQHMEERFDAMHGEIQEVKADVRGVYDAVDAVAKRLETDEQERLFMGNQLDRHAGWIGQVAEHTNTELEPEQ